MSKSGVAARKAAAHLLNQVLEDRMLLPEALGEPKFSKLEPEDRARAQRLAVGTLRSLERVDRILKPFLRKTPPIEAMNVMRIGTFELCAGGAAHGVVNDAVTILGSNRNTLPMKGMANAVLRKVADAGPVEWEKLRIPRLPKWLRGPLVEAYGSAGLAAMERAHFAGAPLDLTAKGDPQALAEALGGTELPTGSVRLESQGQVTALPGYEAGDWWVQDAAAAIPVQVLAPQPGEAIADLCCAPGGKTLQLAASGAEVTAVDSSDRRMGKVVLNLQRTGLKAEVRVADILEFEGSFDAILLDAPCSATGTIRRHPDLPMAKDGSEFGDLIALQEQMLNRAVDLLKPGGRMVFCTCSLLPDEGECQIDALLETRSDVTVDRAALDLPGLDPAWVTEEGGLRLRPDFWKEQGGMDGFYIAALRKAG
jgi:16S rRNA (cytosine967-C5)-methyltransferase